MGQLLRGVRLVRLGVLPELLGGCRELLFLLLWLFLLGVLPVRRVWVRRVCRLFLLGVNRVRPVCRLKDDCRPKDDQMMD